MQISWPSWLRTSFKALQKHQFLVWCLVMAFVFRLHGITNPVADWHAFRQADTASVSREYVKNGIDLLQPEYHDLSNIASGLENPQGYRMVEFPIVNAVVAAIVQVFPGLSVVLVSRLLAVLASLGTIASVYFLVKSVSDSRTAKLVAWFLALFPFFTYYSRVVLPEPVMLFFSTFSILAFWNWLKTANWSWYGWSVLSLMLALLLKPNVVFTAPVYLTMLILVDGWQIYKRWSLLPFGLLAVGPLLWWRNWITQFPSGIPAYDWLFNSDGIRWRPAWFRWLGYERLTKLMLGWVNLVWLPLNVLKPFSPDALIYGSWWLGMVAYMSLLATGNVRHDYYQVLITPIVAISVARGFWLSYDWLRTKLPKLSHQLVFNSLACVLTIGLVLSWHQVKGFFWVINWEYVRAGQAVQELTPPQAKVIAPAFGDTIFLYQTNRRGWPIGFNIQEKIDQGATHYVTTTMDDEANQLKDQYHIIKQTDEYLLLDLTKPKISPETES